MANFATANYVDVPLTQGFAALSDLATLVRSGNVTKKPRTAGALAGTITCAFSETFLNDSPDVPVVIGFSANLGQAEAKRALDDCNTISDWCAAQPKTAKAGPGPQPVGSWLSVIINLLIEQIKAWLATLGK